MIFSFPQQLTRRKNNVEEKEIKTYLTKLPVRSPDLLVDFLLSPSLKPHLYDTVKVPETHYVVEHGVVASHPIFGISTFFYR